LRAFRLAEARHARTTRDALSGEGAFLFGGRWNPPGYRVVYAAEHLSLAVLELLVHTQDRAKLRDYRLVKIDVPDERSRELAHRDLPAAWQTELNVTRELGRRWLEANDSLALLVPSVIVPEERNVLLNPLHPAFSELQTSDVMPFHFDDRLLS
jgi:RES domain-containing protein